MNSARKKDKCCICLDNLTETNNVTFDCRHSIHLSCYMNCIQNNVVKCPLCKRLIKQNVTLFNYINLKYIKIIKSLQTSRQIQKTITN